MISHTQLVLFTFKHRASQLKHPLHKKYKLYIRSRTAGRRNDRFVKTLSARVRLKIVFSGQFPTACALHTTRTLFYVQHWCYAYTRSIRRQSKRLRDNKYCGHVKYYGFCIMTTAKIITYYYYRRKKKNYVHMYLSGMYTRKLYTFLSNFRFAVHLDEISAGSDVETNVRGAVRRI